MVSRMWGGLFTGANVKGKGAGFWPAKDLVDCPQFVDYRKFGIETPLSGRAMRTLSTQVCGLLSAATEKRRRALWRIAQPVSEKFAVLSVRARGKILRKTRAARPDFGSAKLRLDSLCSDIKADETGGFVQLKSLGKSFDKIRLPFGENRVSQKWLKAGKRLAGIEVWERGVKFSYEIQRSAKRGAGLPVGVDQGLLSVATMSDGTTTPSCCPHGHSLKSVIERLSRRKKGSRGFGRSQRHRTNLVNWSINMTNLRAAPEVRLEKIWNIGFGHRKSRKLSHWTNTVIRDKIAALCEEAEVPLVLQNCTYRSQRCAGCGWVQKASRKGKLFVCKHCGRTGDADYNASCNHAANLPSVHWTLRKRELNRKGFFWKEGGFFDRDGAPLAWGTDNANAELTVPRARNYTLRRAAK